MSWRTIAAVLIVVFSIVLVQSVIAGPLVTYTDTMSGSGDYSNEYFDGNALIESYSQHWFNMGLILIFGMMVWGALRVYRREATRGRL